MFDRAKRSPHGDDIKFLTIAAETSGTASDKFAEAGLAIALAGKGMSRNQVDLLLQVPRRSPMRASAEFAYHVLKRNKVTDEFPFESGSGSEAVARYFSAERRAAEAAARLDHVNNFDPAVADEVRQKIDDITTELHDMLIDTRPRWLSAVVVTTLCALHLLGLMLSGDTDREKVALSNLRDFVNSGVVYSRTTVWVYVALAVANDDRDLVRVHRLGSVRVMLGIMVRRGQISSDESESILSIARLLFAIAGKGAVPDSAVRDANLTPAWNSLGAESRICDAIVRPWVRRMIASAACAVPECKIPDELRKATALHVRKPDTGLGGEMITREMVIEKYGKHVGVEAADFIVRLHNENLKV